MKNFILGTLIILGSSIQAQETSAELIKKVEGFSHPESIIYDRENDVFYVSNIGDTTPGDGFISKLDSEGEILELKFIEGLNDPKGLLLLDNKLYVTDVTDFVEMDIETGTITATIKVEGAGGLNDITVDKEGDIFISDSRKSSIYINEGGKGVIKEWMLGENLEFPNGLLAVEDNIYVAAWGQNTDGNLLQINKGTKEITKITTDGIGNLDGIQLNEKKTFYISDWSNGDIHEIGTDGEMKKIISSEKTSGDILFRNKENQLVLPMNHQNSIWWYQL